MYTSQRVGHLVGNDIQRGLLFFFLLVLYYKVPAFWQSTLARTSVNAAMEGTVSVVDGRHGR